MLSYHYARLTRIQRHIVLSLHECTVSIARLAHAPQVKASHSARPILHYARQKIYSARPLKLGTSRTVFGVRIPSRV